MNTNEAKSESVSHSVMSDSFPPHGLYPTRLLCPWNSTEEGNHFFLWRIFPTQGLNPGLLHYWQILYHQSQQGSPTWHLMVNTANIFCTFVILIVMENLQIYLEVIHLAR